jgi:hypothetical protein
MKKLFFTLVMAISMVNLFGTTYYWIGGATGNWSDVSKWSLSSGGAAASAVPGTADDAIFDTSSGASPTVTLSAATAVNTLSVSTGGTVSLAGATPALTYPASTLTVNTALTFSGNSVLSILPTTSGQGLTLGNGSANFTLTGCNATNYLDGNSYTYFAFNVPALNPTSVTPYFNPTFTAAYTSTAGFGAITVTKGTINLGNNVTTARLILSSNNSQQLILGANTTFNLVGNGSSQFSGLSTGGVVDASASGCKFILTSSNATILNALGRIFKPNTVINSFEMNKSTATFIPPAPMTVNNLVLTAGTINNSTNANITVANGGTITRTAGRLLTPPVYGTSISDLVNLTIAGSCTADNEVLGSLGKIGTLTINSGITYTVFNLATAPGYYLSAFNGGIGYSTAITPTVAAPPSGNAPNLSTAVNYGYLNTITSSGSGLGLYSVAPSITFAAPSVSAWVANTAYIVNNVVSSGANYYVCTTAGTSSLTTGPSSTSASKDGVTDGTAKWACLGTSLVTATATATMLPTSIMVNALTNNGTLTDGNVPNVISVSVPTANTKVQDSKISMSSKNGNLTINGLNNGDLVSVYSAKGQLVKTLTATFSTSSIALPQGVYVVKVISATLGSSVEKVIVE